MFCKQASTTLNEKKTKQKYQNKGRNLNDFKINVKRELDKWLRTSYTLMTLLMAERSLVLGGVFEEDSCQQWALWLSSCNPAASRSHFPTCTNKLLIVNTQQTVLPSELKSENV